MSDRNVMIVVILFCTVYLTPVRMCSRAEVCGMRPKWAEEANDKRITGGHEAKRGSWPWMTNIFVTGLGEYFKCGAALISERWVLTAAHCTIAKVGPILVPASRYPEMLKVRLGEHNMNVPEGKEQDIPVEKVFLHPKWNIEAKDTSNGQKIFTTHDIALLLLSNPVKLGPNVQTLCLDSGQDFQPGKMCYIAGWGNQRLKGPPTRVLHEAALPLVSLSECNRPLSYNGVISDSMICAGFEQGGVDTCEGDSGGPLMCQRTDEKWFLTGVASFGYMGCGLPYKYGVYTRVRNHIDWIKQVTGFVSCEQSF